MREPDTIRINVNKYRIVERMLVFTIEVKGEYLWLECGNDGEPLDDDGGNKLKPFKTLDYAETYVKLFKSPVKYYYL